MGGEFRVFIDVELGTLILPSISTEISSRLGAIICRDRTIRPRNRRRRVLRIPELPTGSY
ncbi:hypothetical protein AJ87_49125 [Rhizobium yanglingense]|nr:hypothetical protein AJ87_49125 [Rhizobium yanglingense]